tara:strand:+ start:414 stop:1643 length:1230 start_codon:yes stop_codon:yes gene_type:complete
MNIHEYLGPLFGKDDGGSIADVSVSSFDGFTTVEVSSFEPEDRSYIERTIRALNYVPVEQYAETAKLGVLTFTNEPVRVAEVAEEELKDMGFSNEEDDEIGDAEPVEITEQEMEEARDLNHDIDGNRRPLKVLCDPDNKKMADKLFSGMLGNTEDYSMYASFLQEFDTFLLAHRPDLEEETRRNMSSDDDDDEYEEVIRRPKKKMKNLRREAPPSDDGDDEVETASLLTIDPMEMAYFAMEFAKEKSSRSVVLSTIMKAMSGSVGANIIGAWEAGDMDAMGEALGGLATKIMEEMPVNEDEEEESNGDDESTDDEGGDDDSDADSDSDEGSEEDDSSEEDSDAGSDEDDSGEEDSDGDESENDSSDEDSSSNDDSSSKDDDESDDEDDNKSGVKTDDFVGLDDLNASKE